MCDTPPSPCAPVELLTVSDAGGSGVGPVGWASAGAAVGSAAVGCSVGGAAVGCPVPGAAVGCPVPGAAVGCALGCGVATGAGVACGSAVGAGVCAAVGCGVGAAVAGVCGTGAGAFAGAGVSIGAGVITGAAVAGAYRHQQREGHDGILTNAATSDTADACQQCLTFCPICVKPHASIVPRTDIAGLADGEGVAMGAADMPPAARDNGAQSPSLC